MSASSRGRPQNRGFKELYFRLKRKNVKNKMQYFAVCLNCQVELKNTSESRLRVHRRSCVLPKKIRAKLCKSDSISSTDSDTEAEAHSEDNRYYTLCEAVDDFNIENIEVLIANENVELVNLDKADSDFMAASSFTSSNAATGSIYQIEKPTSTFDISLRSKKGNRSQPSQNSKSETLPNETSSKKRKITNFLDNINEDDISKIKKAIGRFFFGCNIPLSTVGSDHFINLIKVLRPSFVPKIPGQKELSTTVLDAAYEDCIQESAHLGQNSVMLIDGWKNSASNSKTVVTMIHNNTNNSALFLHAEDITTESETSESLLKVVETSIEIAKAVYNTNIYSIVSDNASNTNKLERLSGLWHSNCNSHTANLLVKDIIIMPEIHNCLDKVYVVLKEFKNCDLERMLTDIGGHKIKLPNETRWCSQRDSIFCLLFNLPLMRQIQVTASNIKIKQEVKQLLFDDDFESTCKHTIELLDPVCELINAAQSATCSLSDIVDMWINLKENLVYLNTDYTDCIRDRINSALNVYALCAYYFDINKDFQKLETEWQNKINNFLIKELNQEGLLQWIQYKESTGIFQVLKEKEITDPIVFWKTASLKCSVLSQLAIKLLQLPASSAQMKRLFLNWSYVHSKLRNKLTFERSKKLLHVYNTLKIQDSNKSDEY